MTHDKEIVFETELNAFVIICQTPSDIFDRAAYRRMRLSFLIYHGRYLQFYSASFTYKSTKVRNGLLSRFKPAWAQSSLDLAFSYHCKPEYFK